jgi:hypothetical protein
MTDEKNIIEMKSEETDTGEILYTQTSIPRRENDSPAFFSKIAGIAVGVAIFFLLITFFVYIILPIIAIFLIWALIKNIYRSLSR